MQSVFHISHPQRLIDFANTSFRNAESNMGKGPILPHRSEVSSLPWMHMFGSRKPFTSVAIQKLLKHVPAITVCAESSLPTRKYQALHRTFFCPKLPDLASLQVLPQPRIHAPLSHFTTSVLLEAREREQPWGSVSSLHLIELSFRCGTGSGVPFSSSSSFERSQVGRLTKVGVQVTRNCLLSYSPLFCAAMDTTEVVATTAGVVKTSATRKGFLVGRYEPTLPCLP